MSEQKEKLLRERSSDDPSTPPLAQIGFGGMVRHLFQRLLGIRGLVVSLFIHLMLMMVAIVWVTSSITEKTPKQPEFIATGSGGGASRSGGGGAVYASATGSGLILPNPLRG